MLQLFHETDYWPANQTPAVLSPRAPSNGSRAKILFFSASDAMESRQTAAVARTKILRKDTSQPPLVPTIVKISALSRQTSSSEWGAGS